MLVARKKDIRMRQLASRNISAEVDMVCELLLFRNSNSRDHSSSTSLKLCIETITGILRHHESVTVIFPYKIKVV